MVKRDTDVPAVQATPKRVEQPAEEPHPDADAGDGVEPASAELQWADYPAPPELVRAVAAFMHLTEVADEEERGAVPPPPLWPMAMHAAIPDPLGEVTNKTNPAAVDAALIPRAAAYLDYSLRRWRLQGALVLRKLLSVDQNPPIDAVIATGAVPRLARLITAEYDDEPKTQFEALWALTNVASGTKEQTAVVVEANVVPLVVRLLSSPDVSVAEQATWMLGNIAGDSAEARNFVLQHGAVAPTVALLRKATLPLTLTRNAAWALSNFTRSKPHPRLELLGEAPACFAELLMVQDEEVRVDALWGLSYVSDISDEARAQLLNIPGLMPKVFAQMQQGDKLLTPALRVVGNFCSGSEEHTAAATEQGLMTAMPFLLNHPKRGVMKEAAWTLSNVLADQPKYISLCLASNVWPHVLNLLATAPFEVKKEAAWCVANAMQGGSTVDIAGMIAAGTIATVTDALSLHDPKILAVLLEGLDSIVESSKDDILAADASNGDKLRDALERLQEHSHEQVHSRSVSLLEALYDAGGEEGGDVAAHFGAGPGQDDGEGGDGTGTQNTAGFSF